MCMKVLMWYKSWHWKKDHESGNRDFEEGIDRHRMSTMLKLKKMSEIAIKKSS